MEPHLVRVRDLRDPDSSEGTTLHGGAHGYIGAFTEGVLVTTATLTDCPCARISDRLAQTVGQRRYQMWFDQSAHLDYDGTRRRLAVAVPNRFIADRIDRDFHHDLRQAATDEVGPGVDIDIHIDPTRFTSPPPSPSPEVAPEQPGSPSGARDPFPGVPGGPGEPGAQGPRPSVQANASGNDRAGGNFRGGFRGDFRGGGVRHRLDQFVVGPANELAFRAAAGIAEEHPIAHPVFLHGGCGLGKTHLLQGACRQMLDRNPAARVQYTTGEQFTNQFIHAVRTNTLDTFRKRVRRLDLLALDDVHFIANKEKTQREFLHSFDAIDLAGARLILASDCHPKQIKLFSEALTSRCVRGLVVELKAPDLDTRRALVRALAKRRGLTLLDDAADTLAERCGGSVREIEGTLAKLHALASLTRSPSAARFDPTAAVDQPVGHALLHRLFEDPALSPTRRPVRVDTILKTVCERFDVPVAQVTGSSRHKHLVLARSVAIHLARQLTSMSYPEIAIAFGKKNHSTIVTADKRIEKALETNAPLLLRDGRDTNLRSLLDELRIDLTRA